MVDFDGTDDGLDYAGDYIFSSGTAPQNGMTWFAIVQPDASIATKSFQYIFDFGAIAISGYGVIYGSSSYGLYASGNFGGAYNNTTHSRGVQTSLLRNLISFGSSQVLNIDGAATPIANQTLTLSALSATQITESPIHAIGAGPFTVGHQSKSDGLSQDNIRILDGSIAELIGYNRILSAAEINRVESYLAIKYGITLDATGGGANGNYTASNGTLVWNASVSPGYHNNVIGIARDAQDSLLQKQSHTMDDVTRVYLSTLATTNTLNAGSFSVDNSFVMVGSNTGLMCATHSSNAEIPPTPLALCTLYSRIEREWKVTKTNFNQSFNMDFTLSSCGVPLSVNVSELRLLVDDDGNFSNGGTQCYRNGDGSGITFTYSNPRVTVTGLANVHIPNNATRYITIASTMATTPLSVDLAYYNAELIDDKWTDISWETASETNVDYYVVEKSSDLTNWQVLTKMDGKGTSNTLNSYRTKDEYPFIETTYYKLTQIDFDGTVNQLGIRVVSRKHNEDLFIYPNPGSDKINLISSKIKPEGVVMYSIQGDRINYSYSLVNNNQIVLNVGEYSPGIYLLEYNSKTYRIIVR